MGHPIERPLMFNPHLQVQTLELAQGIEVHVIDNVLAEPRRWVAMAAEHRVAFQRLPHNAYPGVELHLPDGITAQLQQCFDRLIRSRLDARRCLEAYTRLALVTDAPAQLQPRQWICHRDRLQARPGESVAASVLYLFEDPSLGGTRFFHALRPESETARLIHDSGQLAPEAFTERYGFAPGYLRDSGKWFETVGTVTPRFNRLIFYDGMQFHCSDIPHPERLSADPAHGRLTLNGFFTCRRRAS